MKKGLALRLIFLLSSIIDIKGQSTLVIDTGVVYTTPTTFNSTDQFNVTITNVGPQPFTGMVHIIYALDSTGTGSTAALVPLKDDSIFTIIPINGYISDSTSIPITPGVFRHGINTVVIWPRMSSASGAAAFTIGDSVKVNVLVDTTLGMHDLTLTLHAQLFPNPAQQVIYMVNKGSNTPIEQVRFFNAEGKLLFEQRFTGKLDLSQLTPGVYFIELLGNKGRTARYKVIKE